MLLKYFIVMTTLVALLYLRLAIFVLKHMHQLAD